MKTKILISLFLFPFFLVNAQIDLSYQVPPEEMISLVDAPPTPSVQLSPDREWMLILEQPSLPAIDEVSQPELRIAGIRINPQTNGKSRAYRYYNNIRVLSMEDQGEHEVAGLPSSPRITNIQWSPDGQKIAFCNTRSDGVELWVLNMVSMNARKITDPVLNDIFNRNPFEWLADSRTIVYRSVDKERGEEPEKPGVPHGPVIRENTGKVSPVRTYQDLLQNHYDELLFEYYAVSQLVKTTLDNEIERIGKKGIIHNFSVSPGGEYILVEMIQHPFSYLVPYYYFPVSVEIWDVNGNLVKQLASLPLADDIPKGFGSVRKGPRSFTWRADASAEIYWVEALDEGDAFREADYRDQLFSLAEPFNGKSQPGIKYTLRYGGISWGNDALAVTYEYWWRTRREIISTFKPDYPDSEKRVLFDRSSEDIYTDPGNFVMRPNKFGRYALMLGNKNSTLYLRGRGASSEGNKPFLDQFDLVSKKSKRLWQSEAPYYEYPTYIIDIGKGLLLTRRESVKEQPNYFIRNIKKDELKQITFFPHPHPQFSNIKKVFLTYHRQDGVQLTGTLYLPYQDDEMNKNLPVVMWAYPREFKSAGAAGQVDDSPYRFDRISYWSSMIWLTQGYAVFDDPKMPIIGEGEEEPNDSFVEQLVMSAAAAIDTLVAMGIADPGEIAIGGHSYGAFMTANLLAHSDLFATGIARSGAYNRTLTPFGFQAEERTFWEAPEVYFEMSPFMHADKINEPILLIHGEADNNSGTFPIQSQRFYHALKGHGATVRLVMLPHESHGYIARESILHMLWEMNEWFERYLKQ